MKILSKRNLILNRQIQNFWVCSIKGVLERESVAGYWPLFFLNGGYINNTLKGSMINFYLFNLLIVLFLPQMTNIHILRFIQPFNQIHLYLVAMLHALILLSDLFLCSSSTVSLKLQNQNFVTNFTWGTEERNIYFVLYMAFLSISTSYNNYHF